jgi:hypothetical protein
MVFLPQCEQGFAVLKDYIDSYKGSNKVKEPIVG